MLIRFDVNNWKSFREFKFSAIAGKERSHGERIPRIDRYHMRVLPTTAIYGGNASGKTNFFSSLNFVRHCVVYGNMPGHSIGIEPFALSQESRTQASSFRLEILVDDVVYEYSFTMSKKEVLAERLTRVDITSETVLFDRKGEQYEFSREYQNNKSLRYVSEGTQPNILFLTNSVFQRRNEFLPVYAWFRDVLTLIAPDSRFEAFEIFMDKNSPTHGSIEELLERFDTGVVNIGATEVPLDQVPVPGEIKETLKSQLQSGNVAKMNGNFDGEKYLFHKGDEELTVTKMVTIHHSLDDTSEIKFGMKDESDGTLRLLDLIPMLRQLMDNRIPRVYVVDELDRSFHYLLTQKILELYLGSCGKETRSQLLFTTHDLLLMDQKLFRRDEMWITDRVNGQSELLSIGDFQLRCDKDIRKAYLNGRFGGIPRIY